MQSGQGARPEYASKRLVAVKRMKKKWEGGWDECKKLKELEVRLSLRFSSHTSCPLSPVPYPLLFVFVVVVVAVVVHPVLTPPLGIASDTHASKHHPPL